jgi:hypothetical protein
MYCSGDDGTARPNAPMTSWVAGKTDRYAVSSTASTRPDPVRSNSGPKFAPISENDNADADAVAMEVEKEAAVDEAEDNRR